jgi:photosystem II stability/assembly factor-like uncharacterized protein
MNHPATWLTTRLWRLRRLWLVGVVGAAGMAAPAGMAAAAVDAAPVPAGFVPSSTSWVGADQGWVLGFAPGGADPGEPAPALLRTMDGGQTWQARTAPPVRLPDNGVQVRVFFANRTDGLVTDGQSLFATHDGGAGWRSVRLAGVSGPVAIGPIAANTLREYAVVTVGTGDAARTTLYSSPLAQDWWTPAAGVSIPGQGVPASGGWDVVARGSDAAVALGVIFESSRFWTSTGAGGFREATAPCGVDARTDLAAVTGRTYALCSSNPGRGFEAKQLLASDLAGPAGQFTPLGPAPDAGITRDFAAGSRTVAAVAAAGGGASFIHLTTDGGQTWTTPLTLDPDVDMFDLAYQDPTHAVFTAGGPTSVSATVYRSTDAGQTWKPLVFG